MRCARFAAATAVVAVAVSAAGIAAAQSTVYDAAISTPKTDPYYPTHGSTSFDALHYGLDLQWHRQTAQLVGVATIDFRAPRSESRFRLDLEHQLHVRRVTVDGVAADIGSKGNHLFVFAPTALGQDTVHQTVIHYRGRPEPVRAPTDRGDFRGGVGWTTTRHGQAWTMQEPYGAFTWYPVNDHPSDKAFYDITATTQASWHTVANGRLVSDRAGRLHRTMHWHLDSPAASYLITIAIGPYRRYRDRGPHGLPLTYWLRPVDHGYLDELRRSPNVLRWLEARLGQFPFSRAGAVIVPSRSGMETQTMLTLGRYGRRANYGPVIAHEYAHQWYGDTVTPDNWKDLWMNEAFAMWVQFDYDVDHGFWSSWRSVHSFLEQRDQALRDKYGPPGDYKRRDFAETNVYFCGALMLDELRKRVGNRTFAKLLRGWPQSHLNSNANRRVWIRWINQQTGRHLGPFVHNWLTSPTTPR